MSTHYQDIIDKVLTLHEESLSWTVQEISLDVATSLEDDTKQTINLCNTIGQRSRQSKYFDHTNVYWLPKSFDQNNKDFRSKVLLPFFQKACSAGGFMICSKGWEVKYGFVRIACTRFKCHKEDLRMSRHVSTEGTTARHLNVPHCKRSQRPHIQSSGLEACKCPFGFMVYWHEESKRWYLPKKQGGSLKHIGHPPLHKEELRHRVNIIGEDNVQLTQQSYSSEIRPGQAQNLIKERTGTTLESWQIRHQFRKKQDSDLLITRALGTDSDPSQMTAADRLLHDLESSPNESCYALFARFDTDLLTIVAKKKREQGQLLLDEVLDPNSLQDSTDSASDYASRVRRSLSITGSGQILLGVAWTNNEARRKFEMFPELTSCDVTMGTNAEERPLILFMGKDSLNNGFVHTYAFLPSQSRWIFDWFFSSAVPGLHSTAACEGVQVTVTDQDGQLMGAFKATAGSGGVLPNAVHRNCSFHKVYRNFRQETKWKRLFPGEDNVDGQIELDLIVNWLNAFCKDYETEQEAELSWRLFLEYLEEDESLHNGTLGESLRQKFMEEYLTRSFHPQRGSLYAYNFKDLQGLDESTSNLVEGTNSGMKRSEEGPRPKDSIDRSKTKITKMQNKKSGRVRRQIAFEHTSVPGKVSDQDRSVAKLTSYANKMVWTQYDHSQNMKCFRSGEWEFLVKHSLDQDGGQSNLEEEDRTLSRKERASYRCKHFIPRFERTRVVKLVLETSTHMPQQLVMKCSCNLWQTHGYCCRHIYALLDRTPVETDAKIRWWNVYYHAYGQDGRESISAKLHFTRKHGTPSGVPLTFHDNQNLLQWPLPNTQEPVPDFFASTLHTIKLRHPSYWSYRERRDTEGNTLPPETGNVVLSTLHGLSRDGEVVGQCAGVTEELTQTEQLLPSQMEVDEEEKSESLLPFHGYGDDDDGDDEDVDDFDIGSLQAAYGDNNVERDDKREEDGGQDGGVAGVVEARLSRSTILNSYNEFLPIYQDITRMVRCEDSFHLVRDYFRKMHEGVLTLEAARNPGVATTVDEGQTQSLPEVDKRQKDNRKRKFLSPPRKKSNR